MSDQASVALVAVPARCRELAPFLVARAPVPYALERVDPRAIAELQGELHDVVVVDGESLRSDEERRVTLERLREPAHRFTAVIYVSTRLPSDDEIRAARAIAHDVVWRESEYEAVLGRRVELVAVAAWRYAQARRTKPPTLPPAKLHSEIRFRAASSNDEAEPEPLFEPPPPSLPFEGIPHALIAQARLLDGDVHDRVTMLARRAFREGRRSALRWTIATSKALSTHYLERELATQHQRATQPEELAQWLAMWTYESDVPVVIDAFFGGEADGAWLIGSRIADRAREALAAVEQRIATQDDEPVE